MYIKDRGLNRKGEGCYEIRVIVGYDAHGKQKRWTKVIHAQSMQGARKIAAKMKRGGQIPEEYSTTPVEHIPTTFQELADQWKEEHYPFLAPRTQTGYSSILENYILNFFSQRPIQKITVEDIRRFIRHLHTSRTYQTRSGKLSSTMINKCFRLLAQILASAEDKKFISQNPCRKLSESEIPRPDYHHAPIWQKEELMVFIQHLEEIPNTYHNFQKKVMFDTFLMTGMRKGELSVLHWSDIDVPRKSIQVTKALKLMTSSEIIIDKPKTEKSAREIFIDDFLMARLNELWERQKAYLLELGRENEGNYIFITQRRKSREIIPVSPSYLYMWLRREAKKCGLPPIDVHSLRHMAATYALASGAPILGVQNMMGHTSLRTTSIYLHTTEQQMQQASHALSSELAALRKSDSNDQAK